MKEFKPLKLETGSLKQYPTMEGESPFAKRFNEVSAMYWVETGRFMEVQFLIDQLLIEHYNETHLEI